MGAFERKHVHKSKNNIAVATAPQLNVTRLQEEHPHFWGRHSQWGPAVEAPAAAGESASDRGQALLSSRHPHVRRMREEAEAGEVASAVENRTPTPVVQPRARPCGSRLGPRDREGRGPLASTGASRCVRPSASPCPSFSPGAVAVLLQW